MTAPGTLVLVVGPSGAGKDTLINAARERLEGDPRFAFPHRIVTRDAVADLEEHDTVDWPTFERRRADGTCALSWEAHGLGYLLPREIDTLLANGKTVVCNVSRRVIAEAERKYRSVHVIVVTADRTVRTERLFARGRETREEIAARLEREPASVSNASNVSRVDNSGQLGNGIAAFVEVLQQVGISPGTAETTL